MEKIFAIGEKTNGQTIVLVTDREKNEVNLIIDGEKSSYEELDKLFPSEDKQYYSYLKEAWLFKLQTNLKDKVDVKYIESEFNTPNCYIEEEKSRYGDNNLINSSLLSKETPFSIFTRNLTVDFKHENDLILATIYKDINQLNMDPFIMIVDNVSEFKIQNVLNNFIETLNKYENISYYKDIQYMKEELINHQKNYFYDLYIEIYDLSIENENGLTLKFAK